MDTNKEIGNRINKKRIEKGFSLRDLGDKSGLGHTTISRYEKGNQNISINKLELIANSLNTTVEYLMYGMSAIEEQEINYVNLNDTISIPLFASISCGDLSSVDNVILEHVEVPAVLKNRFGEKLFAVVAKGDSMDRKVPDGFIAVFAQDIAWENGDAVAVLVNGEDITMKNIYRTGSSIVLEPDSTNPNHNPIVINCKKETVKVIGRLIYMYKDF